jgi:hypothetical protein
MNTREILRDLKAEKKKTEERLDSLNNAINALEACNGIHQKDHRRHRVADVSDLWDKRITVLINQSHANNGHLTMEEAIGSLREAGLISEGMSKVNAKSVIYHTMRRFPDKFVRDQPEHWIVSKNGKKK